MGTASKWMSLLLIAASSAADAKLGEREPEGLHLALQVLEREGKFNGAVVVRDNEGIRFERGYGWADPFELRPFSPDTPVDSGSLAKPVTAAAVLLLIHDGRIDLDGPVQRYLPEYPHSTATVRHLLSHSAGLDFSDSPDALANKSNAALLATSGASLFPPGSAFNYCNMCSVTLAMLIERVSGMHYLEFVKRRLAVPREVSLRPASLGDWNGRAVGYLRKPDGGLERFDSWEGELFYGPANLSISANQLAEWGSKWWQPSLQPIRQMAVRPALIGRSKSGLSLGNWYCAQGQRRCHYLGHHEGFHHMLYWDADRRVSVAMVTNNALAPSFQQRLQRALIAFAENRPERARRELRANLSESEVPAGVFKSPTGEKLVVKQSGTGVSVERRGVSYPAYPTDSAIRYVPGLDAYIAGDARGRLRWITLYEKFTGVPLVRRCALDAEDGAGRTEIGRPLLTFLIAGPLALGAALALTLAARGVLLLSGGAEADGNAAGLALLPLIWPLLALALLMIEGRARQLRWVMGLTAAALALTFLTGGAS